MSKFGVKNVQVSRDSDYRTIDYGYNRTASYYADRDELIEMELTRTGFENLVKLGIEAEKERQEQRDQAYLRSKHPVLEEAYSKYCMLLELYK
jgi:predicted ATPase